MPAKYHPDLSVSYLHILNKFMYTMYIIDRHTVLVFSYVIYIRFRIYSILNNFPRMRENETVWQLRNISMTSN